MSVVPVSMAANPELPVGMDTELPCTVSSDEHHVSTTINSTADCYVRSRGSSQKLGVTPLGMLTKSISPVNKLEFVPPRVNAPPGSFACTFCASSKRVSQKAISGELNWLPLASVSQNGVACDCAMGVNPRPISPETGANRKSCETWSATAGDAE